MTFSPFFGNKVWGKMQAYRKIFVKLCLLSLDQTGRNGQNDKPDRRALSENSPEKGTGLKGFEPLTCGLRVRRYAELSYRPAC
jgi:hypothetical protein